MRYEDFIGEIKKRYDAMPDSVICDIGDFLSRFSDQKLDDIYRQFIMKQPRFFPRVPFFKEITDEMGVTAERREIGNEFNYCTKCDVYFYGCYAGKKTKSRWNDYVKRCPECHKPENFATVITNRWIDGAVPMKDHCYGSDHYGCKGKKDLPGAKCSDWGRGEYQEYCKSCQCQKCCADDYRMRQEERGT